MSHEDVELHVPVLARVEGEGAMHVRVEDGVVSDIRLEIYEPPRFFEAFLRGRGHAEPVDITARICGICPVAYQMSACHAIERACGVHIDGPLRELRRLLYCGEWIGSHVLHIGFLHAPDFLGYDSGIAIAAEHPAEVEAVLQLKKIGNDLVDVLGGRPIHPVNVRLGGFHRTPSTSQLRALRPALADARRLCIDLVRWTAGFDFPDHLRDDEYVSLHHPDEYPLNEGRLVSTGGLDVDVEDFGTIVSEEHVAHSTALHSRLADGRTYHVGPSARWANNHSILPSEVRALAADVGVGAVERNPFKSILIRGLETFYAITEAERIIESYEEPDQPFVPVPARAGEGCAVTEAPRGSLYHRYRIDDTGTILDAEIVPPTAQNQPTIEADLRQFVEQNPSLDHDELQRRCEQAIRNYDPCISCATHFLTLHVDHV